MAVVTWTVAGIAGTGHILISAGFTLLLIMIGGAVLIVRTLDLPRAGRAGGYAAPG